MDPNYNNSTTGNAWITCDWVISCNRVITSDDAVYSFKLICSTRFGESNTSKKVTSSMYGKSSITVSSSGVYPPKGQSNTFIVQSLDQDKNVMSSASWVLKN